LRQGCSSFLNLFHRFEARPLRNDVFDRHPPPRLFQGDMTEIGDDEDQFLFVIWLEAATGSLKSEALFYDLHRIALNRFDTILPLPNHAAEGKMHCPGFDARPYNDVSSESG
jgi:hypothetical protein